MAKKSLIERENKKKILIEKYMNRRMTLKQQIKETYSLDKKLIIHRKLQNLPRNSASNRSHNRCFLTGRSRAYYRFFGLSRHFVRELAHNGLLPGVTKSSW
uniref:Small ribosomal subunit protein uS14c n=1 Tax=Entransia fimbriata TaxID=130991 RepID=A0A191T4U0_9VIRI|nr:ribosomal protein S14 [Entransia fimbriata]ANI25411.1 ribosomal protein S14 [Entransia fimbriata]WKT05792.1 ribosomal protein S14 [Entransia fimbriata]WKT05911.1 ribosomal protein S14 [Entransia fimbriata]